MPASPDSRQQVQFAEFTFDLRTAELWRNGEKHMLPHQCFQILTALLEQPGEMVSREKLVKRLWASDVFVDFEGSLNKAIKRLREALNDTADHPRFIETLPRHGYRFIAPLTATPLPAAVSNGLIGKKISHYRVLDVIGGGGMGMVYMAEDLKLDRRVALKFLPEELASDPIALKRFEREARTASALNHTNICTIHDIDEYEGQPVLIMEFLEGETLRDRLAALTAQQKKLAIDELVRIALQLCAALQAAHEKNIIHRDIKPANIFLTKAGQVKLLDFGLAKLISDAKEIGSGGLQLSSGEATAEQSAKTEANDATLTRFGVAIGTAGYMSPEQLRGEKLDARTDLFSFGLVLYEMATGQRAFHGETSVIVRDAILNAPPIPLAQLNSDLPANLIAIINKALEKERERRWQSAEEVSSALVVLRQRLQALQRTSAGTSVATESGRALRTDVGQSQVGRARRWAQAAATLLAVAALCGLVSRLWPRKPGERPEVMERQLTASIDNPVESDVISSDGKYLAYSDQDGISIQEIDNGDTRKLTGTMGLLVEGWYPDGLRLLVDDDKDDLSILLMVSGEKRTLASHVPWAELSPDGTRIAYVREVLPRQVWTMPAAGGEPKLAFEVSAGEFLSDLSWSPDGQAIADILSGSPPTAASVLETRRPVEAKPKVLLADIVSLGNAHTVLWPRADRILFNQGKGVNVESDLWALALDSKGNAAENPVRLTNMVGTAIGGMSASANGERAAVLLLRESAAIFVADLSKAGDKLDNPVRLTRDTWDNVLGIWTPDSQTLFYGSLRDKLGIYNRRLASDSPEPFLVGGEHYAMGGISADGSWYIVTANARMPASSRSQGETRLLRVPVSGGAPELILKPERDAQVHCGTGRSRICILSEAIGSRTVFTEVDPVRGRLGEIARVQQTHFDWSLSPDGSRIALVNNRTDKVQLLDLRSKELSVIRPVPPLTGMQEVSWSADGTSLFLTGAIEDLSGYFTTMDLSGRTHMLLQDKITGYGNPRPSPDGKRIAYVHVVSESNVMLLEHF